MVYNSVATTQTKLEMSVLREPEMYSSLVDWFTERLLLIDVISNIDGKEPYTS